jgi:hypothetical protein
MQPFNGGVLLSSMTRSRRAYQIAISTPSPLAATPGAPLKQECADFTPPNDELAVVTAPEPARDDVVVNNTAGPIRSTRRSMAMSSLRTSSGRARPAPRTDPPKGVDAGGVPMGGHSTAGNSSKGRVSPARPASETGGCQRRLLG